MSLVLYRKYRPQSFAEFIGQEHIVKTLTNAIARGMVSHAYLFSGPRGTGKTTLARLLAKAVNCKNRKEGEYEPCNKCSSCLEITEGNAIDLLEIDAASHRGIDDIRELKDGIKFSPTKSKHKVFIIDESHQLTKEASNALLKTLEEPPEHAIFILATTEIHKMIPTIISRCQRFDFRKLTVPEIMEKIESVVKKEKIKIEKTAEELIAINAGGAIRDAESLLNQIATFYRDSKKEIKSEDIKDLLGLVEVEMVSKLTGFLCEKATMQAIDYLNDIGQKGMDMEEFSKTLISYLRKALIVKIIGGKGKEKELQRHLSGLTKEEVQTLIKHASCFSEKELKKVVDVFLAAQNKMRRSPIPQLPLELAIVEVCEKD
jgi:DNA polymerase-3 subunit gamma/tau